MNVFLIGILVLGIYIIIQYRKGLVEFEKVFKNFPEYKRRKKVYLGKINREILEDIPKENLFLLKGPCGLYRRGFVSSRAIIISGSNFLHNLSPKLPVGDDLIIFQDLGWAEKNNESETLEEGFILRSFILFLSPQESGEDSKKKINNVINDKQVSWYIPSPENILKEFQLCKKYYPHEWIVMVNRKGNIGNIEFYPKRFIKGNVSGLIRL